MVSFHLHENRVFLAWHGRLAHALSKYQNAWASRPCHEISLRYPSDVTTAGREGDGEGFPSFHPRAFNFHRGRFVRPVADDRALVLAFAEERQRHFHGALRGSVEDRDEPGVGLAPRQRRALADG